MAKNPKRVAAGKKLAARMKREGRGIFAGKKKKSAARTSTGGSGVSKKGGKPKLPSLAKSVNIVGGVVVITGLGVDATDGLIGNLQGLADAAGLGMVITGATVVLAVNGLKAAASLSNWFGRKYRAFLRGYGFRP